MKIIIYIGLFFLSHLTYAFVNLDDSITPTDTYLTYDAKNLKGIIGPGRGYSRDMQEIAYDTCFNTKIESQSNQESELRFDIVRSFADLQQILQTDVSAKGKFGPFSADAGAHYLRSISEKDYSLSVNYYQYARNEVQLALARTGINALTPLGQEMYTDKNKYKNFDLMCGDDYVVNYHQGALLVGSLNIDFKSSEQKKQFQAHAGAAWGNMFSASADIQRIATQYNINGSVTIQAYQKGGDPSQLAKIINGKDSSGNYYILTCDLKNMPNCVNAANSLLSYASNDFSKQFSFTENKGLVPLGIIRKVPIENIGLKPPQTYVTPTVVNERASLFNELERYNYYQQKFRELLIGYPVIWDTTSNIYKNAQMLYQQAQNNIMAILSPSDPGVGAYGCFSKPEVCEEIAKSIKSNIKPITDKDLTFLAGVKYIMPISGCDLEEIFYKKGDSDESWANGTGGRVDYFNLSDTKMAFNIRATHQSPVRCSRILSNGISTDAINYVGNVDSFWTDRHSKHESDCGKHGRHGICGNLKFTKKLSPFYFDAYKEESVITPTNTASTSTPNSWLESTIEAIGGGGVVIAGILGINYYLHKYGMCCSKNRYNNPTQVEVENPPQYVELGEK